MHRDNELSLIKQFAVLDNRILRGEQVSNPPFVALMSGEGKQPHWSTKKPQPIPSEPTDIKEACDRFDGLSFYMRQGITYETFVQIYGGPLAGCLYHDDRT